MKIWIFGEITDAVAESACRSIWDSDGAPHIVLNSPGGIVSAAFAIYDAILEQPWSSVTATGLCGSAANLILQAGENRLATLSTQFSFHNAQSSHWDTGAYADARIREIMVRAMGEDNYREAVRIGIFGTQVALRYGLIDEEDA